MFTTLESDERGAVKFSAFFMYPYMLSQSQLLAAVKSPSGAIISLQASTSVFEGRTRYMAFIADEPPSIYDTSKSIETLEK
jgi:hypothetical protein